MRKRTSWKQVQQLLGFDDSRIYKVYEGLDGESWDDVNFVSSSNYEENIALFANYGFTLKEATALCFTARGCVDDSSVDADMVKCDDKRSCRYGRNKSSRRPAKRRLKGRRKHMRRENGATPNAYPSIIPDNAADWSDDEHVFVSVCQRL